MSKNHGNNKPKKQLMRSGKLEYKLHFTGDIKVLSGMHIGGSEVDLDIGGLDNEVVKVKIGDKKIPYIPGSSIKGKLRSLLARTENSDDVTKDSDKMVLLFGLPRVNPKSRLIFRDCYINEEVSYNLETKSENTIDRSSGGANPRHMERVSKGAQFDLDLMMDVYENDKLDDLLNMLKSGFHLLNSDFLGGGGSRGSGNIIIENIKYTQIDFNIKEGTVDFGKTTDLKLDI